MTTPTLAHLANSTTIDSAVRAIDSMELSRELGAKYDLSTSDFLPKLQVAAILSLSEQLEAGIDTLIQDVADQDLPEPSDATLTVFRKWIAFFNCAVERGEEISPEDMLYYCTAGLMADRPIEVRSFLRSKHARTAIETSISATPANNWRLLVRRKLTVALLYLVLQEHHDDVRRAGNLIKALADEQKEQEGRWLDSKADASRDALSLLGQYHLAQAVRRTAEFLLVGSLTQDGKAVQDFAPELGRLLTKAEEYFSISNDQELLLWLHACALVLSKLRKDSIWVQGLGISERLDQLVASFAQQGKDKPIFSLLPSQRDALRKNLLDPSRIAVILQMPTSAGKTLLAEFAMVQTFEAYRGSTRIVYMVPTRALATQVRRTLIEDLRPLGIEVSAAGSAFEEDPYEMSLLENSDGIVVATPEKLDLMLRSHPEWFDTLRLVVVDEAHLLKEGDRGVRLELLLANIRRERPKTRLLLLTPFMKNCKDIASWLGGTRGIPIDVHWRPSRILLGLASISGAGKNRALRIEWKEPHETNRAPLAFTVPTKVKSTDVGTALGKVAYLAQHFANVGTILALCGGSRSAAEKLAVQVASTKPAFPEAKQSPAIRLAVALARNDYGPKSVLADCLQKGVAFHHSSLSPTLRYLIEDQVRSKNIAFIAATSTLAQGMNFPVSIILIHSVEKPWGNRAFSASEFWNIAGRSGRVGMVDRGLVLFMAPDHAQYWEGYSKELTESLKSALLEVLATSSTSDLKKLYRDVPEARPFIQYLAHAAANDTPKKALANLEELMQASLANRQAVGTGDARSLRAIARSYLTAIAERKRGYLKAMDETGLGSFSFDELFAKIRSNPVLTAGPAEIMKQGQPGVYHLVDALKWLPELGLAIGHGEGAMDVSEVATVVQGWIDGKSVFELSHTFPGDDEAKRTRNAGTYINSTISQTMSWGAHAYLRGWLMNQNAERAIDDNSKMLPAYIQYGVHTAEATIASLLNVPRPFAEASGEEYRQAHGNIQPNDAKAFKTFIEAATTKTWESIVKRSKLSSSVRPDDLRTVWRQMQGLE